MNLESQQPQGFSVLISIYHKEKPAYFDQCMHSILDDQILKPNEIILVQDGPLTPRLQQSIDRWSKRCGDLLKIIPLKENKGLGKALNIGLNHCSYPIIARMDTDDISTPERFDKQLAFLDRNPDIDVVGTYIVEINENGEIIKDIVKYPLRHKELYHFFKKRDPLAHPSVMFRKRFFEKAGHYPVDLLFAEDTLLWYHGFLKDCKFANISFIGLKFRRTSDFYKRRANFSKSVNLLKYRLVNINRHLNYGIIANLYALLYFLLSLSPASVKLFFYKHR